MGVDLEEPERFALVVGVGGFGDFGHVDQGVVGRVVLLGQREGADVAWVGSLRCWYTLTPTGTFWVAIAPCVEIQPRESGSSCGAFLFF